MIFICKFKQTATDHNTSATIEFRENEIEGLAKALHSSIKENKGYISAHCWQGLMQMQPSPDFEPIISEATQNYKQRS